MLHKCESWKSEPDPKLPGPQIIMTLTLKAVFLGLTQAQLSGYFKSLQRFLLLGCPIPIVDIFFIISLISFLKNPNFSCGMVFPILLY